MKRARSAVARGVGVTSLVIALASSAAPAVAASLCTVSNASPLAFDALDDMNRPHDGRATFVVTCARTQTAIISLLYSHRMKGEHGEELAYDLYSSADRSALWGDGGDGAPVTQAFAGGRPTTMYIYARIPAGQRPLAGRFGDDIQIETLPF